MSQKKREYTSATRNIIRAPRVPYEDTVNPLRIPILDKIIQDAVQPQIPSSAGVRGTTGALSRLSLETAQMIADNVERGIDLRSLLLATQWRLTRTAR